MAYKGILFDFDGVIVNSMHQHYEAWIKAFAEKGVSFEKEEFFLLEGQGVPQIVKMLAEPRGLVEQDMLDLIEAKAKYYYTLDQVLFYDHFLVMLENLKQKHIPMAVVTGGNKERVSKVINEYFSGVFDAFVTIDDVENGKPHPEPFIKGAEKLSLNTKECIVVENAPMGVTAAKTAGCTVIAIKTTLKEKHLINADFIFNTFDEVEEKLLSLLSY